MEGVFDTYNNTPNFQVFASNQLRKQSFLLNFERDQSAFLKKEKKKKWTLKKFFRVHIHAKKKKKQRTIWVTFQKKSEKFNF